MEDWDLDYVCRAANLRIIEETQVEIRGADLPVLQVESKACFSDHTTSLERLDEIWPLNRILSGEALNTVECFLEASLLGHYED